jgi:hypothetical protein
MIMMRVIIMLIPSYVGSGIGKKCIIIKPMMKMKGNNINSIFHVK